jgi:hypothetical protein
MAGEGLVPEIVLLPSPLAGEGPVPVIVFAPFSPAGEGLFPRSSLLSSPLVGEGPVPEIVFAPFSPCGRRVGDEGGFGSWHGWRRAGREGRALDRVSPALRAGASNFSLRGQRKVTKRKATPANPLASPVPSDQSQRRTGRRRRHIPVPTAATPLFLMALLTLCLSPGGLEGEQYRARL